MIVYQHEQKVATPYYPLPKRSRFGTAVGAFLTLAPTAMVNAQAVSTLAGVYLATQWSPIGEHANRVIFFSILVFYFVVSIFLNLTILLMHRAVVGSSYDVQ